MGEELYKRLATHLDRLPGGYPATESGVELRILRRLFTPKEAELALHLSLIGENSETVAFRAGIARDAADDRLEEMAASGLILRTVSKGEPPRYMALHFVVGIWEYQVDRLTPELVSDMDEYIPHLMDAGIWKRAPQMRTIPVGRSIRCDLPVMTYENAEALVRGEKRFVVTGCICRKERNLHGDGCDKPLETCISFGGAEDYYVKNGIGRRVDLSEVLQILAEADRAGLVLQPSNGKKINWICCCCGCCCGVLRTLKRYPDPASIVSTPFTLVASPDSCTGCGICIGRCQMDALEISDRKVKLDPARCIGCGLCVSTCPADSLALERKPDSSQPHIPKDIVAATLALGWRRGKIGPLSLTRMIAVSFMDRYRASRR